MIANRRGLIMYEYCECQGCGIFYTAYAGSLLAESGCDCLTCGEGADLLPCDRLPDHVVAEFEVWTAPETISELGRRGVEV